jgi:hypothetical protein
MDTTYTLEKQACKPHQLHPIIIAALMLGFISSTSLLAIAGGGKLLNALYPLECFILGVFLCGRAPVAYIGFCWWACFLTPLVRRVADLHSGYTEPSPILLAPYLIVFASLVASREHLTKLTTQSGIPFLLAFLAIIYSFMIGMVNRSPFPVLRGLLDWNCPIIFGFYIWSNWRLYPQFHKTIMNTFLAGVLFMGAYGLYQYIVAPDWDLFWLTNSGLVDSHGKAAAMELRVWSTLNSAEAFAGFMAPALLLLFNMKSPMIFPASIVGYLSFLLSLVRSGWLGWFVGLISLMTNFNPKTQIRLVVTVSIMASMVVLASGDSMFSDVINDRLSTLTDLQNDVSAVGRQEIYGDILIAAMFNFVGGGLGGDTFDSALLSMLVNLGWIGMLPYMGGLFLLLSNFSRISHPAAKVVVIGYRAAIISSLARLPFNSSTQGTSGMILWGFLALGLAAERYYTEQDTIAYHLDEFSVDELTD